MIDISELYPFSSVALLIDADNVSSDYAEQLLEISEYYGGSQIRRAYGKPSAIKSWHKLSEVIECTQVNQAGGNATDHYMMVDAGELASFDRSNIINVFIIVSGDGDFTAACQSLKDKGKHVIAIGNQASFATSLQKASDRFYFLSELSQTLVILRNSALTGKELNTLSDAFALAYHDLKSGDPHGWVSYGQLGEKLRETFDTYKFDEPDLQRQLGKGKYKLTNLLRYFSYFERDDQRQMLRNPLINPFDKRTTD